MTTLADLTRQVARLVARMASGAATSLGTTTTLIDTVGLAGYPDDNFNGGTLWLTSGANAGRSRAITDFADGTDTLTCAAFPSAIASGVTWEATDSSFVTYADLRQAVNLALREIGKIIDIDETLTSVTDQLIYDLPAGVSNLSAVEIVEDIGDADEKREINNHWDEREGQLIFEHYREPVVDRTIRLIRRTFHTEMSVDTDALSEQVDEEYLVYLAARQALRLAYKRFGKTREDIPEWLNEAIEEAKKHIKPNRHAPHVRIRTA
jgi:hypothetical protein